MQTPNLQSETNIVNDILSATYEWDDCGVIYARYSSHSQTEQSIEGQLRDNFEYAKKSRIKIVRIYIDRAFTGKYDDRPDFQAMLNDSKHRQFKYVIVWKFDRFARNRFDSAKNKHFLKQYGVKVLSTNEPISDNPEGVFLEAMLEANAEYFSLDLAQKVNRGIRESKLKGKYTGGGLPLGYKADENKHIVIDEKIAPIVRKMFEDYAAGKSCKEIINELNFKGQLAQHGKHLSQSGMINCFSNEHYIGKCSYKGEPLDGYFPALIDEKLFYAARERATNNKRMSGASRAKVDYLLSGKIFCGLCGSSMFGVSGTSRTGASYYYYSCRKKYNYHACTKRAEKKDFIEWYIVEQTLQYVLENNHIEYIATRIIEEYDKEFNSGIVKSLEREVKQTETELNKTTNAFIQAPNERIQKTIGEKLQQLDLRLQDLSVDLNKMRVLAGVHYKKEDIIAWIKQFTVGDPMDENFRRRIIDVFVNSVYLYDDKVVIYYNIKDSKQISHIDLIDSLDELNDAINSENSANNASTTVVRILTSKLHHFNSKKPCDLIVTRLF